MSDMKKKRKQVNCQAFSLILVNDLDRWEKTLFSKLLDCLLQVQVYSEQMFKKLNCSF